jgi:hypothetical protein
MKTFQRFASIGFALWAITAAAAEPAEKGDAIVGRWRWVDKQVVECRADQTFQVKPSNRRGKWKRIEATTVEKKYELQRDGGLFTDTLMMSRDEKKLSGKNQEGKRIEATKLETAEPSK